MQETAEDAQRNAAQYSPSKTDEVSPLLCRRD